MIGYYAHHRGSGHLHRAMAIAAALADEPVTILSSAARPAEWRGDWVQLPLDADERQDTTPLDVTARGTLHWVPVGSAGLRARMAAISAWLELARPEVVVVDVSVEVVALVRLHGVPVVTIVQPGVRTDAAHTLGYRLADAIIAPWPPIIAPVEIAPDAVGRIEAVGAISRIPVVEAGGVEGRSTRQIVVMQGAGGRGDSALDQVVAEARAALPDWQWRTLRGESAAGVADALCHAAIAFTHCGQNALAEIAAARIPAVLVPEDRPHEEQAAMGRVLVAASRLPARIVHPGEAIDWAATLGDLTARTGSGWSAWVDGAAARRAADVIRRVAAQ